MTPFQAGQQLGQLTFGGTNPKTCDATPSLFDALSGNAPQGQVYYNTVRRGALADDAMSEARKARAAAIIEQDMLTHRQNLPTSIGGVYTNPKQAALLGDLLLSNASPSLSQGGIMQNPNEAAALGDAATAMQAQNFPAYNRATALASGSAYQPTRVIDSTMLPDGVPLGDAAFKAVPTPAAKLSAAKTGGDKASNYQIVTGADGRMFRVNKLTGETEPLNSDGAPLVGKHGSGKPATLGSADLKLLGDIVTDVTDPAHGTINAKGQQDEAMLAANPTAAMKQYLLQRQPLGAAPGPKIGTEGYRLANAFPLPAVTPAPRPSTATLGDLATGAPAPGTVVRTDPGDPVGAAAASALASVDPTHALPPEQQAKFNNDPRVLTLQRQATKAITEGHADPARVAAKLQQEYSAIGYSTRARGG